MGRKASRISPFSRDNGRRRMEQDNKPGCAGYLIVAFAAMGSLVVWEWFRNGLPAIETSAVAAIAVIIVAGFLIAVIGIPAVRLSVSLRRRLGEPKRAFASFLLTKEKLSSVTKQLITLASDSVAAERALVIDATMPLVEVVGQLAYLSQAYPQIRSSEHIALSSLKFDPWLMRCIRKRKNTTPRPHVSMKFVSRVFLGYWAIRNYAC
jgi:hypothetical protein